MDFKLFLFLISISALPLVLILKFFPWEIPQIHFLFLALLFIVRIVFFREDEFKKNIKPFAREELKKKMGRVPSDPQIIDHIEKKIKGRNVAFFVTIVLTLVASIFS